MRRRVICPRPSPLRPRGTNLRIVGAAQRGAGGLVSGVWLWTACSAAWAASVLSMPTSAPAAQAVPTSASGASTASMVGHAAVPIVSGDLIVKFRDSTEPGRELAAVLAGQRTVASVAPLAARLSEQLGLPLALVQVTSGREALLALDRPALARALVNSAQRQAAVQRASAVAAGPTTGLPPAEVVLHLELRGPAPSLTELGTRLAAGGVTPRLAAGPGGANTLRARYDIDALTLALISRLQQRTDVEYVQPNRLLRPAPGASR
ncbi:MAG: hypothetical protein JNJ89_17145 [Rubrivivax sp.]|nr:hypothetical protein [Rubrivivax sp.]